MRALAASRLPAVERRALFALATFCDADGVAWPSLPTLAATATVSRATLCRALASLEARGLLTRTQGGGRAVTRYRVRVEAALAWAPTEGEPAPADDTEQDTSSLTVRREQSHGETAAVSPCDGSSLTVRRHQSHGETLRAIEEPHEEPVQEPVEAAGNHGTPDTLPAWVTAALPPSPPTAAPAAPKEGEGSQVSLPLAAPVITEAPPVKGRRKQGEPPTLTPDEAAAWEAAEGVRASQAVRLRARPYPPPWERACIRRRLAAGWTVADFRIVAEWFWSPAEAARRATSDPASTYWREVHDGAYLEAAHRARTQPRVPPLHAARIAWSMYEQAIAWAVDTFPGALGEALEERLGPEVAEAVYDAHQVFAWRLRRAPGPVERREIAGEWGADVTARIDNAWGGVDARAAAR